MRLGTFVFGGFLFAGVSSVGGICCENNQAVIASHLFQLSLATSHEKVVDAAIGLWHSINDAPTDYEAIYAEYISDQGSIVAEAQNNLSKLGFHDILLPDSQATIEKLFAIVSGTNMSGDTGTLYPFVARYGQNMQIGDCPEYSREKIPLESCGLPENVIAALGLNDSNTDCFSVECQLRSTINNYFPHFFIFNPEQIQKGYYDHVYCDVQIGLFNADNLEPFDPSSIQGGIGMEMVKPFVLSIHPVVGAVGTVALSPDAAAFKVKSENYGTAFGCFVTVMGGGNKFPNGKRALVECLNFVLEK
jgi:hypothetical protein